jgi:Raf kinase inhibitor-like YbhB/YbcL family protein
VVNLNITSEAFEDGGMIPAKYTGRGENISPSLKLDAIDPKAKTTALIMDDIDHPLGIYNHWVIWNIPASFGEIPEGIPREEVVSSLGNAVQGKSQYGGKHYYRGPLPPFGTHDYIFKVYVLNKTLDLESDAGKAELQRAMEGHILQYGELTGKFGGK